MRVILNNIDSFLTCRKNKIIEKMKEKKSGNTTSEGIIWICIAIVIVAVSVFFVAMQICRKIY